MFQAPHHPAQHFLTVTPAVELPIDCEQVDIGQGSVLVDRPTRHRRNAIASLANQHNLFFEYLAHARLPANSPVLSIERPDLRVQFLEPGDGLEALDHHVLNLLMVARLSRPEVEQHDRPLSQPVHRGYCYGWATTITVSASLNTHSRHCRRFSGSSAAKLSSSVIKSPPCSNARARKTRLRSPCDNCQPVSPTTCSIPAGIRARSSPNPSSRQIASASVRSLRFGGHCRPISRLNDS